MALTIVLFIIVFSMNQAIAQKTTIDKVSEVCDPPCRNYGTCNKDSKCDCPASYRAKDCGMRIVRFFYSFPNQTDESMEIQKLSLDEQYGQSTKYNESIEIQKLSLDEEYGQSTKDICLTHAPIMFEKAEERCTNEYIGQCRLHCHADESIVQDIACLPFESKCKCCATHAPSPRGIGSRIPVTSPVTPAASAAPAPVTLPAPTSPTAPAQAGPAPAAPTSAAPAVLAPVTLAASAAPAAPISPAVPAMAAPSASVAPTTAAPAEPVAEICRDGKRCNCKEGFMKIDMQCVMWDFNSYSQETAQRECLKHNASLGQIESFIKLVRPMVDNGIPEGNYWLGISISQTLEYSWFNGKGKIHGPWADDEPNTRLGCVVLCWRSHNTPQLCSRSCTKPTTFICTYDLTPWKDSGSCQVCLSIGVVMIVSVLQLIYSSILNVK